MHTTCDQPAEAGTPNGPVPVYRGLLACLPTTLHGVSGETTQIQGSPGFQCVYVRVGGYLVAIPLDIAYQVGNAIRDHACEAQLRTLKHLREQGRLDDSDIERAIDPLRRAGL